jgi:fructose-bisphosphate aldolase, class II
MNLVPMGKLLQKALDEGYAIPSITVWNAASMSAVLRVANRLEAPIILMNGPGEFVLHTPAELAGIARLLTEKPTVPVAFHLDHGNSLEQAISCLDAGYTSVMLDFSKRPFEENVLAMKKIVALAQPLGVSVEGEIGAVGTVDEITSEGRGAASLTDPEEARDYVQRTGVDALAVSIGNAHGNYTSLPQLKFDILEDIFAMTQIPIVLHGGSGTPDEDIRTAISHGIAKINVASEIVRGIRESLMNQWQEDVNLWVPAAVAESMKIMETYVESWILKTGAAGKA